MSDAIKVRGLKQFTKDLRTLDRDLPKGVRLVLNDAAQLVVDGAQSKVPRRSGRAARSIRVASTQKRARVRAGSARAPYYAWLDFGGKAGRVNRQFRKRGRYLYIQYFRSRDSGKFQQVMEDGLVDTARKAGIEMD